MLLKIVLPLVAMFTSAFAEAPLEVRAVKMICEKDKGVCVAEGNAIAVSGEENDPLKQILHADTLTVFFDKNPKDEASPLGSNQVQRVEAHQNVKLIRGDLVIISDQGTYDAKSDVVTFQGHVKIKDGSRHYAECKVATYDRLKHTYQIQDQAKILIYAKK